MAAKPVVVGVDGSEEALRAVEWAALEAERRKSSLRIVSVPNMPPRMRAYEGPTPTVSTELQEFSERAIDAAAVRSRETAPGLPVETRLLFGPPAVAITDSGSDALMIVVGARGVGGFTAMLLGSVSRYVAMHAECPVAVIREQVDAVHREIVVGVHDLNGTTGALAFAFEEAALRHAELVAVHAWHRFLPSLTSAAPARDATHAREAAHASGATTHAAESGAISADATKDLGELLVGWRDKYPSVPVRPDVVRGHPAQVLSEYSARADLVVIGRHGGTSGARPAVGSIQHAVLHHARGPVAVIPSAD
jgi:nucleotide-binding universal stress UspA family protein